MNRSFLSIAAVAALSCLTAGCAAPGRMDDYMPTAAGPADHVCNVYCEQPAGQVMQTVKATGTVDAANQLTSQAEQVCNATGHKVASGTRMTSAQCWRK